MKIAPFLKSGKTFSLLKLITETDHINIRILNISIKIKIGLRAIIDPEKKKITRQAN
jgi:hypothetical protein